jgi:hypothetical protein
VIVESGEDEILFPFEVVGAGRATTRRATVEALIRRLENHRQA